MEESKTSSRARVFAIPELVELILLQLPLRDLLLASRISKGFHATITTSPVIQSALFFRPACSIKAKHPLDTRARSINPLLQTAFPGFLSEAPPVIQTEIGNDPSGLKFNEGPSTVLYLRSAWTLRPEAFARKEASWRRMLVCQPPATRLTLLEKSEGWSGIRLSEGSLDFREEEGLRMHTLYDYLYHNVAKQIIFRPEFSVWTWRENLVPTNATSEEQQRLTFWLKVCQSGGCIAVPGAPLKMYRSKGFEEVNIEMVEKWGFEDYWTRDFMTFWVTNYGHEPRCYDDNNDDESLSS
jgi:hypothetical protein